jgi:HemY protein
MRRIIALILISAAVVAASWWIGHLSGGLSVQVGQTTFQAPIWVAIVALLLLIVVIYVGSRLFATIFRLPGSFRAGGERRARRKGEAAITSALTALAAREPADARREAARARRLLGETPQTLLLSAYAGSIAGDEAEAEAAFERLAERKDSAFLGLRGLLRLAIQREDFVRAADLARQAEAAHPGAAWLREERTQLALRSGNWAEALQLTHEDAPKAAFGAAAAEAESDPSVALKLAKQAFKRDPSLTYAAIAYARRLRDAGGEKAAQDVLRRSWALAPNPALADFALLPSPDKRARLNTGINLVKAAPDHPESKLLLARLSLEAGLPDDAQRHMEVVRKAGLDQRRVHLLAADIFEAEGNDAAQKDALRGAASAAPDPEWRCEHCGTTLAAWSPACPVCHTVGRVKWGVGQRGGQLALPHAAVQHAEP